MLEQGIVSSRVTFSCYDLLRLSLCSVDLFYLEHFSSPTTTLNEEIGGGGRGHAHKELSITNQLNSLSLSLCALLTDDALCALCTCALGLCTLTGALCTCALGACVHLTDDDDDDALCTCALPCVLVNF